MIMSFERWNNIGGVVSLVHLDGDGNVVYEPPQGRRDVVFRYMREGPSESMRRLGVDPKFMDLMAAAWERGDAVIANRVRELCEEFGKGIKPGDIVTFEDHDAPAKVSGMARGRVVRFCVLVDTTMMVPQPNSCHFRVRLLKKNGQDSLTETHVNVRHVVREE